MVSLVAGISQFFRVLSEKIGIIRLMPSIGEGAANFESIETDYGARALLDKLNTESAAVDQTLSSLDDLEKEKAAATAAIEMLMSELELDGKVCKINEETMRISLLKLSDLVQNICKDKINLKKFIMKLQSENQLAQRELFSIEQRNSAIHEDMGNLKSNNNGLKNAIQNLTSTLKTNNETNTNLNEEIAVLKNTRDQLTEELSQAHHLHSEECDKERQLSDRHQHELVMHDELEDLTERNERLDMNLDYYKQKYDSCTDSMHQTEASLLDIRTELKESSETNHQLEIMTAGLQHKQAVLEKEQCQSEARIVYQLAEIDQLHTELSDSRSQYKNVAQELAYDQETLMLLEQSLSATPETLTQRLSQVVRHEHLCQKFQSELQTMADNEDDELISTEKTSECQPIRSSAREDRLRRQTSQA